MAKKNTTQASEGGSKQKIAEFRSRVEEKVNSGYTCLGLSMPQVSDIQLASQSDMRSALARENSEFPGGKTAHLSFGIFDNRENTPVPVDGKGTKGKGYIPWGPNNELPNQIYNLAASLPYTAAAIKFLVDLTVGHGPKLMYKWARYAGGTASEELIPYEHAGVLIRGRIRELKAQLEQREQAKKQQEEDGGEGESQSATMQTNTINWEDVVNPKPEVEMENPEDEPGTIEFEIKQLKEEYKEWERTLPEYNRFTEDNNLTLHFLECMTDYWHMDMFYPQVGLELGTIDTWNPKIRYIDRVSNLCARLEEMDERHRINYVYYSETWRSNASASLAKNEIVAYPAVQYKTMLGGLRAVVEKHNAKYKDVDVNALSPEERRKRLKSRPAWLTCPIRYPSPNPYYPRPAWWSIFSSMVYDYASNLVVDKAIARQNSTMWSKIIFIDQEYLSRIFDLQEADTPEKQEKIRNDIYSRVNTLLQNKENNGKTLLMDKYLGSDGKTVQYSIEIIDVPQPASGAETKDELEEISSIIFFAFGVHPALIGAVPGKSGSTGGTYQRELILIKQNLLDPARSLYLKFLQNIASFNGWDKRAVWKISDLVLTTLDRSKTGTEETTN